jgi:hypothetical protein
VIDRPLDWNRAKNLLLECQSLTDLESVVTWPLEHRRRPNKGLIDLSSINISGGPLRRAPNPRRHLIEANAGYPHFQTSFGPEIEQVVVKFLRKHVRLFDTN